MIKKYLPIVTVLAVLFGGAVYFMTKPSTKSPGPMTNAANLNSSSQEQPAAVLTLDDSSFAPNTFTVNASQTIKVKLDNTGTATHVFAFTTLDFSSGPIEPGQSTVVTFTTPSKAGTYEFYCSQPGHKDLGLVGTMVVQ